MIPGKLDSNNIMLDWLLGQKGRRNWLGQDEKWVLSLGCNEGLSEKWFWEPGKYGGECCVLSGLYAVSRIGLIGVFRLLVGSRRGVGLGIKFVGVGFEIKVENRVPWSVKFEERVLSQSADLGRGEE